MTKLMLAPLVLTLVTDNMGEPLQRLKEGAAKITQTENLFEGHDLMHLENVLAHAVFSNLRVDPEDPVLRELETRAWPMMQSAIGMRNQHLQGVDWVDTDLVALIEAIVDDRVRADGMDMNEASAALRDQVHELSILFPSLGLSFGYIGNCDLGCGPRYDDRSWKVFTKLATGASACSDVSWGGYPSQQLGRMVDNMKIVAERDAAPRETKKVALAQQMQMQHEAALSR